MRAVLVVLAVAVAGACGSPHDPPGATSVVTLRDAGAAPQRVIRYAPHGGKRRIRVGSTDVGMVFVVDVDVAAGAPPFRGRFKGVDAVRLAHKGSPEESDPEISAILRQ